MQRVGLDDAEVRFACPECDAGFAAPRCAAYNTKVNRGARCPNVARRGRVMCWAHQSREPAEVDVIAGGDPAALFSSLEGET